MTSHLKTSRKKKNATRSREGEGISFGFAKKDLPIGWQFVAKYNFFNLTVSLNHGGNYYVDLMKD